MSATQVSFAEFALAGIEPALVVESTPPVESMPGPSLDAGLVAHASVGGGECPVVVKGPAPQVLKNTWLVGVRFADGSCHQFRFNYRARARLCARDFRSAVSVDITEQVGYWTWDGFVPVGA